MPHFDADDIRAYYDRHTAGFLTHGQGGEVGAIHRAVWGPGTTTRATAFHYVDDLIAGLVASLPDKASPHHLVDLGCGVGASLCYLAEHVPIRGTGVTLSPVQCRIARTRIAEAGLSDRVRCIEGDYTTLPASVDTADLAYAIESFVHGPSPERFFAQCQRLVRPGGLLVICDDVWRPATSAAAARAINRFTRGWHINTLLRRDELLELSTSAGFQLESTVDLSPWLELRRLRDRVIAIPAVLIDGLRHGLHSMLRSDPTRVDQVDRRYGHLLGGSALQDCLAHGWIGYEFAVFRRQ
jgi:tocopherol O-methyltransferase